jgi:AAA15 family ATPase/GTPase
MIDKIKLSNFTAFKELEVDFSPKINVIIGENGTGKTHLLKASYALCSANDKFKNTPEVIEDDIAACITAKLLKTFMPLDNKIGKMRRRGVSENAQVEVDFHIDKRIALTFHTNSKSVAIQENKDYERYSYEPVFMPTKEVLSFMEGFVSLYNKYHLSFDGTYYDICSLLDLPVAQEERITPKSKWAMDEIEKVVGGKFVFHGGGRVTFKTEGNEFSANAMAEGFRKAGILSRLLETGAIQPGISGPLFWDEPESNMNPQLMKLLVEIILELSRNGQQIILATHDYILLKWINILMDENKDDHVKFHVLYHDKDSREIKIESTYDYLQINPNAIADTFKNLTKEQVSKKMGDLGK